MSGGQERSDSGRYCGLRIPDPDQRRDLGVFVERALRLDPAAVVRLRMRSDGLLGAWVATGLDVLACRVVAGSSSPADVTYGADHLYRGLTEPGSPGVDAGLPMDSAWRGALPGEAGFVHVDDVPATTVAELARRGTEMAREHGSAYGPPASLLDSVVLEVRGGGTEVPVPLRCVLALTALGFMPESAGCAPATEVVRVRAAPSWLRIDARFGSVFRRRGQNVEFTIESAAISR
ncbi:MAG: hypothetical protein K8R24_01780 [Mycobacterium sp.]|jgi:hypothetical protein|nr:hypothetical protein [Mycobacterium sp.]